MSGRSDGKVLNARDAVDLYMWGPVGAALEAIRLATLAGNRWCLITAEDEGQLSKLEIELVMRQFQISYVGVGPDASGARLTNTLRVSW